MSNHTVRRIFSSFTGGLLITLSFSGWASKSTDNNENTVIELATIVTTATKTPRRLEEVPVQTWVLTRTDIEKTHAKNLAEALQYAPGVQLKPIHGKTGQGAWIQGFDADRVLVLINGNPISASTGSTVDVSQVAIGDIEQVEIIKGATSVLYGTSAMGGVINVITREPSAKFLASADISSGNWGRQSKKDNPSAKRHGNFELSTKRERWHAQLVAALTESDGFKAPNTPGDSTQGWQGHKHTLSGNLQYRFENALKFTLMPRYFDEDIKVLNNQFVPGIGNVTQDYTDQTVVTNISTVVEQALTKTSHWKVRAMWEDYVNEAQKASHRKTTTQHTEIAGQFDITVSDSHMLTLGAEYQHDAMDVDNISSNKREVSDETKQSLQAFVQDNWFVNRHLELLPGARIHQDSRFGSHVAPMLNAMYSTYQPLPGRLNIRAGLGNGYRTPNLKELFYLFDHSQIGYMVQGNEDLEPESSISYQLGFEWVFPNENGSLAISAFQNDIDDLIAEVLNPDVTGPNNAVIYEYQNIEQAKTQGMEVSLRQSWSSYFSLDISYNYLEAKNTQTGKALVERPEHTAKAGLDIYISHALSLTNKINYESDQFLDEDNTVVSPNYTTWDSVVNYQPNDQWALYGGVKNITDVQREFNGTDFRPVAGRYAYIGFRYQFKSND